MISNTYGLVKEGITGTLEIRPSLQLNRTIHFIIKYDTFLDTRFVYKVKQAYLKFPAVDKHLAHLIRDDLIAILDLPYIEMEREADRIYLYIRKIHKAQRLVVTN